MGTWVLIRRRRGIGRINPRPAAVICCSLDSSPPIAVSFRSAGAAFGVRAPPIAPPLAATGRFLSPSGALACSRRTGPFPSRLSQTVQASASSSPAPGGPRADRLRDARTRSVAGGRTTVRSTMGLSQVGQSTELTPNTFHKSKLHGVHRDPSFGVFVNRSPTPGGRAAGLGGFGRTARCHRCRPARTPL